MSVFLLRLASFCCLLLLESCNAESSRDVYVKECQGSSTGLSYSGSAIERYETYRRLYSGCTLVTLNLEIVFLNLTGDQYDLSFLEDIREVNGYVLIHGNHVTKIRLNRLRVIRGMTLYKEQGQEEEGRFSLYVTENALPSHHSIGLQELQMTSLVEILHGEVLFSSNRQLCFGESTVDWAHIFNGRGGSELATINSQTKTGFEKINCQGRGTCHESCPASDNRRYCWASGADKCQKVQKCSGCDSNKRCSLQSGRACCHVECVAGCNEANSTEHCLSCRSYSRNKGESCLQSCSAEVYDRGRAAWVPPPDEFVQGTRCVTQCDEDMVLQDGICSFSCKQGSRKDKTSSPRECVSCEGDCPTTCDGTSNWLRRGNLFDFSNCRKVNGNIYINNITFTGNDGVGAVAPDELELLSGVEAITGSLVIDAWYRGFTSLRFLRNLRHINGIGPIESEEQRGLYVRGTSLESIHLNSFESVSNGKITFTDNPQLCFVEGINWTTIDGGGGHQIRNNRMSSLCHDEGFVCSSTCLPGNGCMGPGSDSCITCLDFQLIDGHCSSNCSTQDGFYEKPGIRGNRQCRPCHEQCDGSCSGDGPEDCHKCKNVTHNKACVAKCPSQTYKDEDGICQQCNSLCDECTGNSSVLGQSGCSSCINKTIRYENETFGHCISSEDECNETYFRRFDNVETFTNGRTVMKICRRCHPECVVCKGPEPSTCPICRNYRLKKSNEKDECVSDCSEPFKDAGQMENSTERICVASEAAGISAVVAVVVPVIVVLILIIVVGLVILIVFWRTRRRKRLEEELLIDLIPSKAKPNMASLRLIKESELRRGNTIGSGAFGTVYKGIWIPEKENVKIPVAIKVLQDTSNTSQNMELLDEACIMASVCHPNCVRILAVCMTAQMMLVTQLMPLGCLLDYVRKEKSNIGSRALLLWSVQIAKGMKYLEELGIVHRDLAARNVLVNNSNHVKITDFGLAKLLDYDKEEIHSEGGKMPIKWLALECIQHRIYTHKSDVWSYGVTLWEMFTYGSRPYENLQARQIPQALEKGERLPQPSICTLDVYMTLIKCWMLDVDSRPTFSDLVDEFARMAADPGRFLVIPGDKLMRLPSQAPDARDLFRMMSLPVVDEPHLTIMSGEEYLRPFGLDFDGGSDGLFSPTSSACSRLMSIPEDEVCYENSEMMERRRMQSSEEDSAAAADGKPAGKLDREFSRGGSQRYISDPCRAGDAEGKEDDKLSRSSQIIRVDKDGYIPPQSVTTQPSYLELIHEPSDDQDAESPQTPPQHYMDMNSSVGISKDNLDYFDNEAANLTDAIATNDKLRVKVNSDSDRTKSEELDYYNEASTFTDSQTPYSRLPQTDL